MDANFELKTGTCKPFMDTSDQLSMLMERGLIINDKENALSIIRRTGYYRLSAYSLTLRKNDRFDPGTTFDNIYELYRFDDAFRKIIFDYASYIEIAYRSFLTYEHTKKYGPLGYLDPSTFDREDYHNSNIRELTADVSRSDDIFVAHHKDNLDCVFPFWVSIECSSFGLLSKFFKNLKPEDKDLISRKYAGVGHVRLSNWLQAIVVSRNVAAHGGRFYNRKFRSVRVSLSKKNAQIVDRESAFSCIYIIHRLLPTKKLAAQMEADLQNIFMKYPFACKKYLGFPENWRELLANSLNPKAML